MARDPVTAAAAAQGELERRETKRGRVASMSTSRAPRTPSRRVREERGGRHAVEARMKATICSRYESGRACWATKAAAAACGSSASAEEAHQLMRWRRRSAYGEREGRERERDGRTLEVVRQLQRLLVVLDVDAEDVVVLLAVVLHLALRRSSWRCAVGRSLGRLDDLAELLPLGPVPLRATTLVSVTTPALSEKGRRATHLVSHDDLALLDELDLARARAALLEYGRLVHDRPLLLRRLCRPACESSISCASHRGGWKREGEWTHCRSFMRASYSACVPSSAARSGSRVKIHTMLSEHAHARSPLSSVARDHTVAGEARGSVRLDREAGEREGGAGRTRERRHEHLLVPLAVLLVPDRDDAVLARAREAAAGARGDGRERVDERVVRAEDGEGVAGAVVPHADRAASEGERELGRREGERRGSARTRRSRPRRTVSRSGRRAGAWRERARVLDGP